MRLIAMWSGRFGTVCIYRTLFWYRVTYAERAYHHLSSGTDQTVSWHVNEDRAHTVALECIGALYSDDDIIAGRAAQLTWY